MKKQYFIGIGLEAEDKKLFSMVKKQFDSRSNLSSPPHISLIPPFDFIDEKNLISRLKLWAEKNKSFKVKFFRVDRFVGPKYGTVILLPENDIGIKNLHNDLMEYFGEFEQSGDFVPHLTLAQRVDLDKLDSIKKEVEMMGLELNILVDKVILYRKDEGKSWMELEEINLIHI